MTNTTTTLSRIRRCARARTALAALVVAGTLAACGGDDGEASDDAVIVVEGADGATDATTDGTTGADDDPGDGGDGGDGGETTDEEAAMAFAECMRENGVDDFPDPTVSADGSVDFGGGLGPGDGEDGPAFGGDGDFQAAAEACGDLLEGASFLPDEADLTEIEDDLLAAAECLREQGLDVDDPDLGGGAGGGPGEGAPFGEDFDPDDPEVAAALEACQDVFTQIAPGGN